MIPSRPVVPHDAVAIESHRLERRFGAATTPALVDVIFTVGALAVFAPVLVPSSVWILSAVIRRARAAGCAGFY